MGIKKTLTSLALSGALALVVLGLAGKVKASPLFLDDFETGTASRWINQNGGWQIVNDNGNHVYQQDGLNRGGEKWTGAVANFSGKNYNNAEADMRALEEGDFGMTLSIFSSSDRVVTASTDDFISLAMFPRYNQVSLYVNNSGEGSGTIEYALQMPIEQNRWYHTKIEVENGLINASIDGQTLFSNIPTNLTQGYVCLSTDGLKADFDNVKITPEPTTMGLLALGGLGLLTKRRSK